MKKIIISMFLIFSVGLMALSVLPQNTNILVKMDTTLDSNSAYNGQIFTGTLQSNIPLEGGKIIPAGSKVFGRIVDSKSAGNISGSSKLSITFSEIQVDGFNYGISTTAIGFEGANQTASTAKTVGRTAVVGGLIAEVTGSSGSEGLKKGAAVGAGLLRNKGDIAIKAGEVLQFQTTATSVIG